MRIGYVPLSKEFDAPGDRRRFCYYAARRNLRFEIAEPAGKYDVVVLTQNADISAWSRVLTDCGKIIFDFTDSYLSNSQLRLKNVLRGPAKFLTRQTRRLLWNYSRGLAAMCARSDAVICTSELQKLRILPYCANVHTILDCHSDVVRGTKDNYRTGEVFHLVWEGQGYSLVQLQELAEPLRVFGNHRRFVLHAITQPEFGHFLGGRLGHRRAADGVRKVCRNFEIHAWDESTFSSIACACDLAVVPIPTHDPLHAEKPENRLLLFWRMGVPALASATAAHLSAMQEANLMMTCATSRDWISHLLFYAADEEARRKAGQQGRIFAATRHSEDSLLRAWDRVFESVGIETVTNGQVPVSSDEPW